MNSYEISLMRFQIGVRVKVVKQRKYKSESLIGKIGTILSVYGTQIAVRLDDIRNYRSGVGCFYLTPSELEIVDEEFDINEEENNMENITNYLNIAMIKFVDDSNGRVYEYANFDPELKTGDLCVVKTAHHGLGLAKVFDIVDRNDVETQREIVTKVDTSQYDERVALRARAAELKAKMQERAKQLQDIALYQMLAKEDWDMKALLDEYQTLLKI